MISVLSSSPFALQRVDDLPHPGVDRQQRLELAAVLALDVADLLLGQRGSWRITCGLSETSASLKLGGFGSGALSNACASRGAGLAASLQSWGGFGFGGPPTCGAV